MARNIFVVMADAPYECNNPVRAYADRSGAEAYLAKVRAHIAKRPEWPDDESDEAYEKYRRKHDAWERRHPAANFTTYHEFSIDEIKLHEAKP